MQRCLFASLVLVLAFGGNARADRVHLVGGSVIEGKATRQGDKVVVEVESGELTLAADNVVKIETSDSAVQQFEKRYAKLAPGDVKEMMALADYCRDHEMSDREHQMLQKVIEVEANHKEARARLGYVHTDAGWVTREEQMRAQGMVQHEGQWVTREQLMQIEQLEAQAALAARERDQAQAALDLERKRASAEQEQNEREQARIDAQQAAAAQSYPYGYGYSYPVYTTYSPFPGYGYGRGFGARGRCAGGRCTPATPPPAPSRASFPIAGVRDPASYFR